MGTVALGPPCRLNELMCVNVPGTVPGALEFTKSSSDAERAFVEAQHVQGHVQPRDLLVLKLGRVWARGRTLQYSPSPCSLLAPIGL